MTTRANHRNGTSGSGHGTQLLDHTETGSGSTATDGAESSPAKTPFLFGPDLSLTARFSGYCRRALRVPKRAIKALLRPGKRVIPVPVVTAPVQPSVKTPAHRPGSMDLEIWSHVVLHNEYELPATFSAKDVIIDIGGHIGSFSWCTLSRGAGHVHVYEAFAENYELIKKNLSTYSGRTTVNHVAVWRSDMLCDTLSFSQNILEGGRFTGGGCVIYLGGVPVPGVSLDQVLLKATNGGQGRVRLVKIDCEGSEWPILFTSRRLDLIDEICGEYHELTEIPDPARVAGFPRYNAQAMKTFLESQGFAVRMRVITPDVLGLFWATRKR